MNQTQLANEVGARMAKVTHDASDDFSWQASTSGHHCCCVTPTANQLLPTSRASAGTNFPTNKKSVCCVAIRGSLGAGEVARGGADTHADTHHSDTHRAHCRCGVADACPRGLRRPSPLRCCGAQGPAAASQERNGSHPPASRFSCSFFCPLLLGDAPPRRPSALPRSGAGDRWGG